MRCESSLFHQESLIEVFYDFNVVLMQLASKTTIITNKLGGYF